MYYLHVFYLFFRFVSLCADNLVVIFEVYPLIFVPPDSAHGFVVEDAQVAELLLEVVECAEIYYLVLNDSNDGEGGEPGGSNNEIDLTTEVLRLRGITNPDEIQFEDENGAVIKRSWDSLSKNE